MKARYAHIDRHQQLSPKAFTANYVHQCKPVIITGLMENWKAVREWSPQYFKTAAPNLDIPVKEFGNSEGIKSSIWTMRRYVDFLEDYAKTNDYKHDGNPPPYCHDIPIFSLINSIIQDVQPFPVAYLPQWYSHKWWRYIQFFLGPSRSVTPLHFDCLLTNNLFFQVVGRKKFTLLPADDSQCCYRYNWRWFMVDPEDPDYNKYPQYKKANPIEAIVNPGDVLYMPPGTLHHVRSLDMSISFNIDWHTVRSSINGVLAVFRGMPTQNVYYNFLIALGLTCKIHPRFIFPFYKPYLNYVS